MLGRSLLAAAIVIALAKNCYTQAIRALPYNAQLRTAPEVGNIQGIQRYGRPLRTDPDQGDGYSFYVYPTPNPEHVVISSTNPRDPRAAAASLEALALRAKAKSDFEGFLVIDKQLSEEKAKEKVDKAKVDALTALADGLRAVAMMSQNAFEAKQHEALQLQAACVAPAIFETSALGTCLPSRRLTLQCPLDLKRRMAVHLDKSPGY